MPTAAEFLDGWGLTSNNRVACSYAEILPMIEEALAIHDTIEDGINAPTSSEAPRMRFWVPEFAEDRLALATYDWMIVNPHVMDLYEHFALEALATRCRFGVKLLTERIRWEISVRTVRTEDIYKINNNHSAYIARWLRFKYPEIQDYLSVRVSPGEMADAS